MEKNECKRLKEQKSVLLQLHDEYPGLTIENIIKQIESRIDFMEENDYT